VVLGLAEYLSYNVCGDSPGYLVSAEETDGSSGVVVDLARWFDDLDVARAVSKTIGEGLFDCGVGAEHDPPPGVETRWVRGVCIRPLLRGGRG
jgi:hypothetical protein